MHVFDILQGSMISGKPDINRPPASSFVKSWPMSARNGAVKMLYGRRAFRSGRGKFGLASSYTRLGDMIVLFEGGSVPYVIRPEGNVYKLVGEALVADYLEGHRVINDSEVRTITLT